MNPKKRMTPEAWAARKARVEATLERLRARIEYHEAKLRQERRASS